MKNVKLIILLYLLFCNISLIFAQNSVFIEPKNRSQLKIALIRNRKVEQNINSTLRLYKRFINLICNPEINTIKYGEFVSDSTDNIILSKSEIIICLRNSFCWNIDSGLPKIPRKIARKALLKRQEKLTDEEWKILYYEQFYSVGYEAELIDKYECIQEIQINYKDKYIIHYEFKYDCNNKLSIVNKNTEKIEVTNANSL